jgi:hypothetical protein
MGQHLRRVGAVLPKVAQQPLCVFGKDVGIG